MPIRAYKDVLTACSKLNYVLCSELTPLQPLNELSERSNNNCYSLTK